MADTHDSLNIKHLVEIVALQSRQAYVTKDRLDLDVILEGFTVKPEQRVILSDLAEELYKRYGKDEELRDEFLEQIKPYMKYITAGQVVLSGGATVLTYILSESYLHLGSVDYFLSGLAGVATFLGTLRSGERLAAKIKGIEYMYDGKTVEENKLKKQAVNELLKLYK